MVMEPPPSAAFEMTEPNLLFEFLVVTLDAPAQFRKVHQTIKSSRLRKGRKPVFCRLFLAFRPLDQEPFFWSALPAFKSRWATRMRTRAKREDKVSAEPSCHLTVRQARSDKASASSLTEIG